LSGSISGSLQYPAVSAGTISFEVSNDGTNFFDCPDDTGTAIAAVTMDTGGGVVKIPDNVFLFNHFKVKSSVSQSVTFTVVFIGRS